MASTGAANGEPAPWHAVYPAPRSTPAGISREEVLDMIKRHTQSLTRDYILIDLRRNDHEVGGTIQDSINLPAQSVFPSIPSLYALFKTAGLRKVIWYCSSSRGRGPRAAGWFADYIAEQGDGSMESLVLTEGIKGWARAGDEFVQHMLEYDPKVWS